MAPPSTKPLRFVQAHKTTRLRPSNRYRRSLPEIQIPIGRDRPNSAISCPRFPPREAFERRPRCAARCRVGGRRPKPFTMPVVPSARRSDLPTLGGSGSAEVVALTALGSWKLDYGTCAYVDTRRFVKRRLPPHRPGPVSGAARAHMMGPFERYLILAAGASTNRGPDKSRTLDPDSTCFYFVLNSSGC